jgi:hypothetical protein
MKYPPVAWVIAGFATWWFVLGYASLRWFDVVKRARRRPSTYAALRRDAMVQTLLIFVVFAGTAWLRGNPSPHPTSLEAATFGALFGAASFFAVGRHRWSSWGYP